MQHPNNSNNILYYYFKILKQMYDDRGLLVYIVLVLSSLQFHLIDPPATFYCPGN